MDRREARKLITKKMQEYRTLTYAKLVKMVKDEEVIDGYITGATGKEYGFEVHAFWDDRQNGNIRVHGLIDDGGFWSRTFPVCSNFIKGPNEKFVGE